MDVTIGLLKFLFEMGLVFGQDLSLVASDDLPGPSVLRLRILTASLDYQLLGLTAANLMLSHLSGEKLKTIIFLTRHESSCTSQPI